jgi:hypothetical protein
MDHILHHFGDPVASEGDEDDETDDDSGGTTRGAAGGIGLTTRAGFVLEYTATSVTLKHAAKAILATPPKKLTMKQWPCCLATSMQV